MTLFKKFIKNAFVILIQALPNLAITTTAIATLSYFWHWSFVLAPTVYYLIGQVFSVAYSDVYYMLTKTEFRIFGRRYSYSHKEKP